VCDPDGFLAPPQLQRLLESLPPPLGVEFHSHGAGSSDPLTIEAFISDLNIPLINGRVAYTRTTEELIRFVVTHSGGAHGDLSASSSAWSSRRASSMSISVSRRESAVT
jgi:hypothetical protein